MKIVKCLPEFKFFYCILEKWKFISKIRISKVTDYTALKLFIKNYIFMNINDIIKNEKKYRTIDRVYIQNYSYLSCYLS